MINFKPNEKFTEVVSLLKSGKINTLERCSDFDEYKEFIRQFPASELTSLSLDQYCIGKKDNANFCWWLERGLVKPLGRFSPGSSKGHIIYYKTNGDIYKHSALQGMSDNDALIYTLKIQSVIANADTNSDLSWIDNDDEIFEHANVEKLVTIGNARKLRLLSSYNPELFIPISSSKHLGHFLKVFGCPDDSLPSSDKSVARMLLLLDLYKLACKELELENLSTFAFMQALYSEELNIAPIKDKDPTTDVIPKIWKISHGNSQTGLSQDEHDLLLKKGYVAIGWLDNPDHPQRKKFEAIPYTDYFYLVRNAQIILIGQLEDIPSSEVEGISNRLCRKFKLIKILDEPYPVTELRPEYLSRGGMPSSNSTVQRVKIDDLKYFESDVLKPVFDFQLKDLNMIVSFGSHIDLQQAPRPKESRMPTLNQILFGPPGTGKTYSTVSKAMQVFNIENKDYSEIKKQFDIFKSEGRIEFVTFHQSFSYEDFVEGVRAETNNGALSYSIKDGIFKTIAIEGLYIKFEELFKDQLPEKWQAAKDKALLRKQKTTDINAETVFDPTNYSHKKLILSTCKLADFENTQGKGKPYVLIIDEINRGNTSRVFGELITLIETTKRAGTDEAMDAILPYSQEIFTVPDNLYIIGTMNTADRSLALMDTALRRRFDFIEMMPDPNEVDFKVEGIDIKDMLQTINNRIEALYDREHTIGHAFFMKLKDEPTIEKLAYIFRNNILPLLEEYFFEDWEKITKVLGKSNIYIKKNFDNLGFDYPGTNYSRNDSALENKDTYINIYKLKDIEPDQAQSE